MSRASRNMCENIDGHVNMSHIWNLLDNTSFVKHRKYLIRKKLKEKHSRSLDLFFTKD